ncbi:unnamed protein product [Nezara viridula]|uniref:Protein dead ringer n=1 Tax=Nezara viridula TaxID=85310 RepID=A0A9P0E5L4_NEZVI|nr:unnamed protein product [Nezara viridula]
MPRRMRGGRHYGNRGRTLSTLPTGRRTPINRLPIMAKSVLDLFELYNLVIQRGGLVDVINKKLWQEIIKGLHLPSSITSAAFTLRTQYMKYLYPYECEKRRLSTPGELQAAIDGNRREGRRGSYGTYADMLTRSPSQQSSPLSLVTGGRAPPPPPSSVNDSPPGSPPEHSAVTLTPLEMSRITLWNLYNNNTPQEMQKEALNLEKREDTLPPPAKRHYPDNDDVNYTGAHIKISSRGDGRGSENSLVVSMDINGTMYQGVLFAQTSRSNNRLQS